MVCCIEKGIIKHQLSFECVKSCEDGAGARFSISFRGHQDYELEATSLCDKHKVRERNRMPEGLRYYPFSFTVCRVDAARVCH